MTDHFHRLDAEADRDFLARGETDPFTGVAFRPTNVVVQAADGTVLLRETWEALGERHAGSSETLAWRASGDGAATVPPVIAAGAAASGAAPRRERSALPPPPRAFTPTAAPAVVVEPEAKRKWLMPLLAILGVALLLVLAFLLADRFLLNQPEPEPVVEEVMEPLAPEAVAIAAGEVEGSLGEGDAQANGRYEDRFTFVADSSGRVLTFALASEDFRPDLVIVGPDGQRYEAEASGENGDRVRIDNLQGPGRFQLLVTSREPGGEGAYALRINQEVPIQTISANGQTVSAVLGQRSQLVDGFYRDTYEFRAEAKREYTLALASSAFEVTPTLTSGSTRIQPRGGNFVFTPEADGRYRLVVSSREKGKRGAYTVNLKAGPKPPEPVVEAPRVRALIPNTAPARDSVKVGEQVTYTFTGQVGDRIRVDARALGFSPSIVLVGPDGRRVPGQSLDERASVSETLATAGTYRVVVAGGEGGSGPFQLSMEKTEAPRAADIPRMPGVDAPRTPAPIQNQPYQPQPIDNQVPRR